MENHDPESPAATDRYAGSVPDPFGPLGDEVDRALGELRGRVDEVADEAARFIRARPGTSLLIALGAGYLVGRMLRS